MQLQSLSATLFGACALVLTGCGDDTDAAADGASGASGQTYGFESRFVPGESSVSYSGQVWRQVAIGDLSAHISRLTGDIDGSNPLGLSEEQSVLDSLNFYFRFGDVGDGSVTPGISTTPPPAQQSYDDISSGKDLVGKIAGNDATTDYKDWSSEFVGWDDSSINGGVPVERPVVLVDALFATIAANAAGRLNAVDRHIPGAPPTAENILPVHVTTDGLDLQQLVQKVLLGAVTYSQGTDDYFDDDVEKKGIRNSNERDGDEAFSVLEHQWDEGFGYFGAARDYEKYTDDEIAGSGGRDDWQVFHDSDGNGFIDLESEINLGNSTNAAKRDRGSSTDAPTDFTTQAFDALVAGRTIIANAGETLTPAETSDLAEQRDLVVDAWERAIAATVVHYINEVLRDMATFGTGEYSFLGHAKHWSELKGFSLGLQFNPRKQITDSGFARFHELLGDRPVLDETAGSSSADIADYEARLLEARTILGDSYGFAEQNLGDADGSNGW